MSRNVTESTIDLMIARIQSTIASSLSAISTSRGDGIVTLETPQTTSYFLSGGQKNYQAPGVFIVAESVDFRQPDGANYINALVRVNLSVVVEDRDTTSLTRKAYRYQDAIHASIDQIGLTNVSGTVKIVIKVVRAVFSPQFTEAQSEGDSQGVFRKEILFQCDVEHYEKTG